MREIGYSDAEQSQEESRELVGSVAAIGLFCLTIGEVYQTYIELVELVRQNCGGHRAGGTRFS